MVTQTKKVLAKSEKIGKNEDEFEFEESHFYDEEILGKVNPVTMEFFGDEKIKSCSLGVNYDAEMTG